MPEPRGVMALITDLYGDVNAEMVSVDCSEDAVRLVLVSGESREIVLPRDELLAALEVGERRAA